MTVRNFLRVLAQMLVGFPAEVAAALWRLILILLLLVLQPMRFLKHLAEKVTGAKEQEPAHPKHCCEVPPHVKRKPDPCLYDQFYLKAQHLAVTWDNPDIWLTLLDGTFVESHQLQPGTEYLVNARIHDASFDPALATEVRCFYKPWSFNSQEHVAVELNPDGTEKVVVLHIPPWDSRIAVFKWTTPNEPNQHWCLQVECRHPDDKNPNNNLGQENTRVLSGSQTKQVSARLSLVNPTDRRISARVAIDQYVIPDGRLTLKLETLTRKLQRNRAFEPVRRLMLTRDGQGKLRTYDSAGPVMTSYLYRGFDKLRPDNDREAKPLELTWNAKVNGDLVKPSGYVAIDVAPRATVEVDVSFTVPPGAASGSRENFNVMATTDRGKLLGGVTVRVEVA